MRVVAAMVLASMPIWSGCGKQDQEEADANPPQASSVIDDADDGSDIDETVEQPASDTVVAPTEPVATEAESPEPSVVTNPQPTPEPAATEEGAFNDDLVNFDVGFDDDQPLPPYNAITREEFDTCWQTSINVTDTPAGDVLRPLLDECGFEREEQPEFDEALTQPVTVELTDVSRLEIIEEICQQVGLSPRYRLDRFALAEGPRPYPITFAGPFLVEVRELQENPPYGTGMISLQFTGCTMSPDVNSWLQASGHITATTSVLGAGDINLADGESHSLASPDASATVVRYRTHQNLKNMVRSVDQIAWLSGTMAIELPDAVAREAFTGTELGQEYESGNVSVELTSPLFEGRRGVQAIVNVSPIIPAIDLFAFGRSDRLLQVEKQLESLHRLRAERHTAYFLIEEPPTALEVLTVAATTTLDWPFAIANIPFSRFEEMQEAIEPLMFAAESPVTLTLLGSEEHEQGTVLLLEAVNHSNKDLSLVYLKLRCLDAAREELDVVPHAHPGFPAVAAHETVEIRIPGFVAPAGTVTIEPELVSIRALDATTWSQSE